MPTKTKKKTQEHEHEHAARADRITDMDPWKKKKVLCVLTCASQTECSIHHHC
jgi:hypothetical protein